MAPEFSEELIDPRFYADLGVVPREWFDDRFYWSVELVDRYAREWALALASELDIAKHLSEHNLTAREVTQALGSPEKYRFALAWILDRLQMDGFVHRFPSDAEARYRLLEEPRAPELEAVREAALENDSNNKAYLDLLDAAGRAFGPVLRGETSGEKALLGMGQTSLWLAYFDNKNPVYALNNRIAAAAAVEEIARQTKSGKTRLRVLEVGAGAGSAAEALLEILEERDLLGALSSYRLTDPAAFFLRRGLRSLSERFPAVPFESGPFDLNGSWSEQGIEPGSLDLIYGLNVFHVAIDLPAALAAARAQLAPGGALVIGECLRPTPHQAISAEPTFLLLDGFLNVDLDPAMRPNPGFLTPGQWRSCLEAAGFEAAEVEVVPRLESIRDYYPRFTTGALVATIP